MLKAFIHFFPSRLFCLSTILFWLVMNTLAADNSYRVGVAYGRELIWHEVWLRYLPWWGNWIFITPLTIAIIRAMSRKEQPMGREVARHLMLMMAMMALYWLLTAIEVAWWQGENGFSFAGVKEVLMEVLRSPMHLDILVYLAVASVGITLSYYDRSKRAALRNTQLSKQLLEIELQSLKSQLSPHFLFNTLNTISGLVRLGDKNQAVGALSELSKMFRTVLENQKNQLILLRDEMAFISSYLNIQKIRFEDKLNVEIRVAPDAQDKLLPFMLLHTLVENAVQHGSQLESNHNLLRLDIGVRQQELHILLTNDACKTQGHSGFGIGLDVSRKRLHHLYQRDDLLHCAQGPDGRYTTTLTIPAGENHD